MYNGGAPGEMFCNLLKKEKKKRIIELLYDPKDPTSGFLFERTEIGISRKY